MYESMSLTHWQAWLWFCFDVCFDLKQIKPYEYPQYFLRLARAKKNVPEFPSTCPLRRTAIAPTNDSSCSSLLLSLLPFF